MINVLNHFEILILVQEWRRKWANVAWTFQPRQIDREFNDEDNNSHDPLQFCLSLSAGGDAGRGDDVQLERDEMQFKVDEEIGIMEGWRWTKTWSWSAAVGWWGDWLIDRWAGSPSQRRDSDRLDHFIVPVGKFGVMLHKSLKLKPTLSQSNKKQIKI